MIGEDTWHDLRVMCNVFFELMLKNKTVLELITKMDEKYQVEIKEYIENHLEVHYSKS